MVCLGFEPLTQTMAGTDESNELTYGCPLLIALFHLSFDH